MTGCVDVLIPTCGRPAALAVTLTALGAQAGPRLRILVSDQSERLAAEETPEVLAVLRYLRARGIEVAVLRHLPRRGMAEQRPSLLRAALSLRQDCPVCGLPNLRQRCSHDTSFVADVPVEQVIRMAWEVLASTGRDV